MFYSQCIATARKLINNFDAQMEINACRKDQPFEIVPRKLEGQGASSGDEEREDTMEVPMDTDVSGSQTVR
jgi:hypothetical protein